MSPLPNRRLALLLPLLFAWLIATPGAALQDADLRKRPDPEGTPTLVRVGIFLIDLYSIDDVNQSYDADFVMTVSWRDPRLVGNAEASSTTLEYEVDEIWTPEEMLLNARDTSADSSGKVTVDADGWCRHSQRIQGSMSFRSDLRDFPLDRQELQVLMAVPPRVGPVTLETDPERTGIWDGVSIPNWRLIGKDAGPGTRYLPQLQADVPLFSMSLRVERFRSYYLWKLIVPLIIVVLMSWSVFWISPKAVIQLGLGATSVLTLIAYRFATASMLPPIGYLSRLDLFLTGSSVLVLGALIEAIVTVRLGDQDRLEAADRVDRLSRIVFPVAFLGVLIWSFFG